MASQEIDLNIDLNVDVLSPAQKAQEVEKALRGAETAANKIQTALSNLTISPQMETALTSYKSKVEALQRELTAAQQGVANMTTNTMTEAVTSLREAVDLLKQAKSISDLINTDATAAIRAFLSEQRPGMAYRRDIFAIEDVSRMRITAATLRELTQVIARVEQLHNDNRTGVSPLTLDNPNRKIDVSPEVRQLIKKLSDTHLTTGLRTSPTSNQVLVMESRVHDEYKNDFFLTLKASLEATQKAIMDDIRQEISMRTRNESVGFMRTLLDTFNSTGIADSVQGLRALKSMYVPGTASRDTAFDTAITDFIEEINKARYAARSLPDLLNLLTTRTANAISVAVPRHNIDDSDIENRILGLFSNMIHELSNRPSNDEVHNHLSELVQTMVRNREISLDMNLFSQATADATAVQQAYLQQHRREAPNVSIMSGNLLTRLFSVLHPNELNSSKNADPHYARLQQHFDRDTAIEVLERFTATMAAFPSLFTNAQSHFAEQIATLLRPADPMAIMSQINRSSALAQPVGHAPYANTLDHLPRLLEIRALGRNIPVLSIAPPASAPQPQPVTPPPAAPVTHTPSTAPPPQAVTPAPASQTPLGPLTENQTKATRLLDLLIDTVHFTRDNLKEVKTLTKALIGDNTAFTNSTLGKMFKNGEGFRKYTDANNLPMYDIVYKNRQSILAEAKVAELLNLSPTDFVQKIFDKEQAKFATFNGSEYYGHLITSKQYSMANKEDRLIETLAQLTAALKNTFRNADIQIPDATLNYMKAHTTATLKDLYDYVILGIKQMTDHGLPDSLFTAALPRITLKTLELTGSTSAPEKLYLHVEGRRPPGAGTNPPPAGPNTFTRKLYMGDYAYHSMQVAYAPGKIYDMPGGQSEFIARQMDLYRKLKMSRIEVSPGWTGRALWPSTGYLPEFAREWTTYSATQKAEVINKIIDALNQYFSGNISGESFNLNGSSRSTYNLKKDGLDVNSATLTEFGNTLKSFLQTHHPIAWFNIGKSGIGGSELNKFSITKGIDGRKLNMGWAIISALRDTQSRTMNDHEFDMSPQSLSMKTLEYSLYDSFKKDKTMTPAVRAEYAEFLKHALYEGDESLIPAAFRQQASKGSRQYYGSITNALRLQERTRRVRRTATLAEPTGDLFATVTNAIAPPPVVEPPQPVAPPAPVGSDITDFLNKVLSSTIDDIEVLQSSLSGRPLEEIRAHRFTVAPGRTVLSSSILRAMMRRRIGNGNLLGAPLGTTMSAPQVTMPDRFPLALDNMALLSAPMGAELGKFAGEVPVLVNRIKEFNRFTEQFLLGSSNTPISPVLAQATLRRALAGPLLLGREYKDFSLVGGEATELPAGMATASMIRYMNRLLLGGPMNGEFTLGGGSATASASIVKAAMIHSMNKLLLDVKKDFVLGMSSTSSIADDYVTAAMRRTVNRRLLGEPTGNVYDVPDIYRPRKQEFHEEEKSYSSANREGIVLDFSYLDKSQWANTNNKGYRFGAGLDQNFESAKNLASMYRSFTGKTYDMEYGFVERVGDREFYNPYKARGLYDPASIKEDAFATDRTWKGIIGLTDAEEALGMSSERTQYQLNKQKQITLEKADATKKLSHEIERLSQLEHQLKQNTEATIGFNKTQINNAVSAFTDAGSIRMKRADIGTGTTGAYRDTVLEMYNKAEQQKNVNGVPFWVKDYYKGADGKIYFTKEYAEFESVRNKKLGTTVNKYRNEAGEADYKFRRDLDANAFNEDLVKRAQSVRNGHFSSMSGLAEMLGYSTSGNPLAYNNKGGVTAFNVLANPKKLATDLERYLSANATVFERLQSDNGLEYITNSYQVYAKHLRGMIYDKNGNMKSNDELKKMFTDKQFTDIFLKRLESNITSFDEQLQKAGVDALTLAAAKSKADVLQEKGQFGTGYETHRMFLGATGTIVKNLDREGTPIMYGGTEQDYLYRRFGRGTPVPPKSKEQLIQEGSQSWITRKFGISEATTYEGALQNASMYAKQLSDDLPRTLQALNLSYTKAAFAFSRVAYGMRIISMELTAMGRQIYTTFNQGLRYIYKYTDGITKATETQTKARISLTGIFDANRADEMVKFARQYAVTSPATFGEITQMMKSFGLTPQIRDMIQGSKDMASTLKELSYVTVGLGSTKPQQGIEGAMFAIREAMSGQFTSLKRRFEISPDIIASMMGVSLSQMKQSPETFVKGLKKFLDLNVGEETLQKLSMTYQVQLNNISDFIEQAQAMIGNSGFYDVAVGIANKIADAFASILNIPAFKEKMQTISDYMSITAGSIVTGLGNMAASILPLNDEESIRKDIEAQTLKNGAGMSMNELKTRADMGISIMKITQLLTSGLRLLSEATKGIMTYFTELFGGLKLNEETLFEYAALIGKILKAFGDLAATVVKTYLDVAQFVTNSGISRGFQAMFLLFTMFPVASANIAINTLRGMFETILALYSPQLHSALSGITTHFMQLSGAMINLSKTAFSWKAVKEGMDAIYNPMMDVKNMADKTELESVMAKGSVLKDAYDEGIISKDNYDKLRDELAKRADILTSPRVVGAWEAGLGRAFSMAALGARVLIAGALAGILVYGIAEAFSSGDAKQALLNTAKRVVGLFAYINDGIAYFFGDGWIGTIVRAGGIVALIAPAASWQVAVAGWNMFSTAAIAAFSAIQAHPAVLALTALIAGLTYLSGSEWFKTTFSKAGAESYIQDMNTIVKKRKENELGPAYNTAYANLETPEFINKYEVYNRYRKAQNKNFVNPVLSATGGINPFELEKHPEMIADFAKFMESTGELGLLGDMSKHQKLESLASPAIMAAAEKRGAEALKNLGLSIDDYEKKTSAAATTTNQIATSMINAANASRNLAANYKNLLGLNLPDMTDPESVMLKPYLQKAQSLELLSGKANEVIEKYAKQDKKKELAEIDALIAKEKELDKQREDNLYGMLAMRDLLTKTENERKSVVENWNSAAEQTANKNLSTMFSTTSSFNDKIISCYNGLTDTTTAADGLVTSINKLSGLSFSIPVTLLLQISEGFNSIPSFSNLPGGGAVDIFKQAIQNTLVNAVGNTENDAHRKAAHDIITKNSKIPGLLDAKKQAGSGGEDKASQLKEKYSKMLKDLDKEILESQGHNIKARIIAAKHEADAKLEEVEREFKGTKYLAELKTKIEEAETAKRIKMQKELKKEIYSDLMNSKYASPDMQMKAYDYIKGEELKSKLTNIQDMAEAKLISAEEAKSLEGLARYTDQMERLEKQYEVLKAQPKLSELIGGKDADKLIDNLTGNFAKYVTTLDEYNKRVGATTVLTGSYDRILNQTDKSKYVAGNTTYTTTTKTTIDQNKLRSPRGLTNGTSSNALLAEFANLYEREQLGLLKQEVEQMRQMSELQIARLQQNGQVYGMSVDTVRAMREQVITAKALMEVEELHYKQLERNVKMSNDIKLQMKYAVDEAVRQLPSNYEIVKSATQGMFGTLKEGLSNVLVAGFSRDTEKMKDIWSQLMTDLKTAFFKMAADLIVKGWMEKLFGGFFPNQEKEKQQKQDSTVSMLQAGLNAGSAWGSNGVPVSNMIPGIGAFNTMQSALTAATSAQQMNAMNMSTASNTAVTAVYNLAQACAEAASYIKANVGGGGDVVSQLLGGGDNFWSADLGTGINMHDVVDINALGIKPFATGGIVSTPTLAALRDGGQNEAVVPLPNGRAIPVEMTGNGQASGGSDSLTIINVLDKEVVNQMIAENPNTVLNVISADIIKGGPVSKAINIRRK